MRDALSQVAALEQLAQVLLAALLRSHRADVQHPGRRVCRKGASLSENSGLVGVERQGQGQRWSLGQVPIHTCQSRKCWYCPPSGT